MNHAPVSPLVEPHSTSWRDELAALFCLAAPIVGANLLQMAIAAVDVMFVARLGPYDLAAATLGAFLFNLLFYALIGLGSAAAPLIAAELGRRAHAVREVRRSFRMAMWVVVLGAFIPMLVLWQSEALLLALGQKAEVASRAGAFLFVLIPAIPLAAAAGVMRITSAALGRPGWTFAITGLALAVDLLANWVFIFGHLGIPAMGLVGSALANLLTFVGMALAYAIIFVRDRRLKRHRLLGRWWRFDAARARDIVRLGLPIMAIWILEGGLFGGAGLLMGLIGVAEVAAHGIALNIAAFAFQIPFGIAQAATVRVGLAFGARDPRWVALAGNVSLVAGIGVMCATAFVFWAAPGLLISAYLDPDDPANAEVVSLSLRFLAVAAIFQLADGAQAVAAGILRGLQDTRIPMLIALFGYWVVGFGCSIGLGFATPLAGQGVWWGLAAGLLVVATLLIARWRGRRRLGLVP
ncbi:MAG TPA: MATE family efflux transporter [Sphingomonas sp.]|nr:MATE family efflux transporter [Sphingomonas sp.]